MAYDEGSSEALLGAWCEAEIARRAISHGWHVLHTAEVGDGATMVEGPGGKVVMPDLQLLDLARGRKTRFVEVKAKRGAYRYQKMQVDCTGIDWPNWGHYCRINGSGVPVDLAFVHLHWPLRSSPEIEPKLLWQTVTGLSDPAPMRFDAEAFPHGAAVWPVEQFELLGDLPLPPPEVLAQLDRIRPNLRAWETGKPRRLRRPRVVPGQMELGL